MKTIYMEKRGQMQFRDRPLPQPESGRAIIAIDKCGLCGTDVAGYKGIAENYVYPLIIGHEAVGRIVQVEADNQYGLQVGDRVVCEPYTSCGECYPCTQGRYNCCDNLRVAGVHRDGMLAEQFSHELKLIHKIPDEMTDEQACMVEPFAIGVNATRRLKVEPGDVCVITGGGAIGLICAMVCRAKGGIPIVADPMESRLDTAREMGIEFVCNNVKNDLSEYICSINGGRLAHCLYECSGAGPVVQHVTDYVENTGRIVLVGWTHGNLNMDMAQFIRKEVDVYGSRNASHCFPEAIELVSQKIVDAEKFITVQVPFNETLITLQKMVEHPADYLKVIVQIQK